MLAGVLDKRVRQASALEPAAQAREPVTLRHAALRPVRVLEVREVRITTHPALDRFERVLALLRVLLLGNLPVDQGHTLCSCFWGVFALVRNLITVPASVLRSRVAKDAEVLASPAIVGFHPWVRERLTDGTKARFDFRPGTRYVCDDSGILLTSIPGGGDRPRDDSFTNITRPPTVR
ncbi:MAG: hypothetical protein JWN00_2957 [Actinomycetia bacterium]|nr:hypothetical protein [Actinomycetes bacterium]